MTTNKELDAAIASKLIHAVYYSYKIVKKEECVQEAMKVPGATPEIMRQFADNIERQSAKNEGVEWGDVRARVMDSCWASALREAAARVEAVASPKGAHGWPLVPSKRWPGEMTLACPKCSGTNITMTVAYGPGGRLGDPGATDIIRCESCKHADYKAVQS